MSTNTTELKEQRIKFLKPPNSNSPSRANNEKLQSDFRERALVFNGTNRKKGIFVPTLCRIYELGPDEVDPLLSDQEFVEVSLRDFPSIFSDLHDEISKSGTTGLERLHSPGIAIIVTQNCNLTCSYCLAKQGTFGLEVSPSNIGAVKTKIAELFKTHPDIDFIKFFGGEPTLRIDLIENICTFVTDDLNKHVHFALTTNGTLDAASHIDLYRRFHISVSVSIDGPRDIHDAIRIKKNGNGSFDQAITYANYLTQKNFPFAVVGVFDERHFLADLSYLDTIKYLNGISPLTKVQFLETLGDADTHDVLADVSQADARVYVANQITEAVDSIFEIICNSWIEPKGPWLYDNNLMRFIYGITSGKARPYKHACTASSLTTIFPGGEIMPCYTFSEVPGLHLGRMNTSSSDLEIRREKFRDAHTWDRLAIDGVRTPWYRGVVGDICVADMHNSAKNGVLSQSSFYSIFQESAVRRILQKLLDARNNSLSLAKIQHAMLQHQIITGEFTSKKQPAVVD